jgi:tetratricopeptide (TPR) repeat protein
MKLFAAALLVVLLPGPAAASSPADAYAEALGLYRSGEADRAAGLLERALTAGVDGSVAAAHWTLLGWCRLRQDKIGPAGEAFGRAEQIEPASGEARTGIGYVALRQGQPEEARAAFDRVVALDPRNVDALKGLGLANLQAGDPTAAIRAFDRALEVAPDDAETAGLRDHAVKRLGVEVERRPRPPASPESELRFEVRAGKRRFEIRAPEGWRPVFVKGVNLGTALPGKWPTEFPDDPVLYRRWFDQMRELGVNAVRLYTLHPPSLYRALLEHNDAHPEGKLWLIQGVWAVLPPGDDFDDPAYVTALHDEVRRVIDAVHGNLELPHRPGHASGIYDADLSADVLALLIGREWEPYAVHGYEKLRPGPTDFDGRYVRTRGASAMESWMAGLCETAVAHESEYYRRQHPVGFASWPTLDPLHHPTEATAEQEALFRGESPKPGRTGRIYDEDVVSVDPTRLESTDELPAGLFASYHVYPYYPDFLFLDPDYGRSTEQWGERRYRAYLEQLRRYHGDQPVLVAEFGLPSSRGISHLHPEGLHHGGHTTADQGRLDAELLSDIHDAGMAGGIVFAWIDEWFKSNWAVYNREVPTRRNRLWLNVMDPEQNFGLIAAWPGEDGWKVTIDGRDDEWKDVVPLYEKPASGGAPLRDLRVTHDAAYLYLGLGLTDRGSPVDWARESYWIGIDTYDADRGDHRLPTPVETPLPIGLEFLIRLEGPRHSRLLVDRPYRIYEGTRSRPCRSETNAEADYVEIIAVPNRDRYGRDGTHYPARQQIIGTLRQGTTDPASPAYDSLADWATSGDGDFVEVRIPWTLLNVTDPSSHQVVHERSSKEGPVETTTTAGFRFHVVALRGESRPAAIDRLPTPARPSLADYPVYRWPGWEQPAYHLVPKRGYAILREHLGTLD